MEPDGPLRSKPAPPGNVLDDCWNVIGNAGDGTCKELGEVILCRNCPVFTAAGRELLERAPPAGYADEWVDTLRREKGSAAHPDTAVLVFRLGREWLALPISVFCRVVSMRSIHWIPHRSGAVLMGLTNVHGALRLCVSLHELLGLEGMDDSERASSRGVHQRMAMIEKAGEHWVFPVDEVRGMHRIHAGKLLKVPATVSRSAVSYTRGLFEWDDMMVALLDDDLLFHSLRRSLS